jgi:glycosyl transferase family 25
MSYLLSKCLFINLEERKDRLKHVTEQLKTIGISGERVTAVKTKMGAIGCTMSHIKCLEMALERNYENVFICEDDILFVCPNALNKLIENFNRTVQEWDVCIIGGNNGRPFKLVNDGCLQVFNCQTTTGYIVQRHYFEILIKNFRESVQKLIHSNDVTRHALDIYWKKLQQKGKWFLLTPIMAVQKEGYSDIEKKHVDYRRMMMIVNK